jgi:fructose-1,6-bisphosphatase I
MTQTSATTIERFINEQRLKHPESSGVLSGLLYDLAFAGKIIAREVRKAGLVDILGATGEVNVQGEEVQKLDEFAEQVIIRTMEHTGRLCVMGSEEQEGPIHIPEPYPTGKYVLLYDPLDGSSNIDFNVSIGTIFSVHQKVSDSPRGSLDDLLQPGYKQVAAGYIIYGSSTMLVYTTGNGVHGFTLDPSIGEFLLSHPNIKIPEKSKYYSVNESYYTRWSPEMRSIIDSYKGLEEGIPNTRSARYIGSLVADFHRNLIGGGVFLYPADRRDPANPKGKLRLLYEAAPLAMIAEQAGGAATNGTERILDMTPTQLHQRVPLFIGNKEDIDFIKRRIQGE